MVMAYGMNPGASILVATDSDGVLLCSVERLDEMFNSGLKFEALVSQMALVEAALHMYTLSVIQIDGLAIKIPKKPTFGDFKRVVIENNLIADAVTVSKLEGYVADRNNLAHNLIAKFASTDLDASYKVGAELISYFRQGCLVRVLSVGNAL